MLSKCSWSKSLCSIQVHPLFTHSIFCIQLELITRITGFCLDKYLQHENTEVWGKRNPEPDFLQAIGQPVIDDTKASQLLSGAREDRDPPLSGTALTGWWWEDRFSPKWFFTEPVGSLSCHFWHWDKADKHRRSHMVLAVLNLPWQGLLALALSLTDPSCLQCSAWASFPDALQGWEQGREAGSGSAESSLSLGITSQPQGREDTPFPHLECIWEDTELVQLSKADPPGWEWADSSQLSSRVSAQGKGKKKKEDGRSFLPSEICCTAIQWAKLNLHLLVGFFWFLIPLNILTCAARLPSTLLWIWTLLTGRFIQNQTGHYLNIRMALPLPPLWVPKLCRTLWAALIECTGT